MRAVLDSNTRHLANAIKLNNNNNEMTQLNIIIRMYELDVLNLKGQKT